MKTEFVLKIQAVGVLHKTPHVSFLVCWLIATSSINTTDTTENYFILLDHYIRNILELAHWTEKSEINET